MLAPTPDHLDDCEAMDSDDVVGGADYDCDDHIERDLSPTSNNQLS